uniref:Phlebovirus glycoprotein G2 fusion domain-containing protein n=1 Tax=Ascaris lumbricoides TaxID=6252 RepID=A0A0M3IKU2_ASCLU
MGCRKNFVDATLCLCNDHDECNDIRDDKSVAQAKQVELPNVQCRNYAEAPYITPRSKSNLCTANYCFYAQTEVANFVGEREVLTMANCGQMPQYVFDLTLSSIWPGPALYSGGCYLLQMQGDNTNLGCMCAEDSCNAEAAYPVEKGTTTCYLAYGVFEETAIENDTCRGDYCFLQKTNFSNYGVQYLKGCLSVNDSMAVNKITNKFHLILDISQLLNTILIMIETIGVVSFYACDEHILFPILTSKRLMVCTT